MAAQALVIPYVHPFTATKRNGRARVWFVLCDTYCQHSCSTYDFLLIKYSHYLLLAIAVSTSLYASIFIPMSLFKPAKITPIDASVCVAANGSRHKDVRSTPVRCSITCPITGHVHELAPRTADILSRSGESWS